MMCESLYIIGFNFLNFVKNFCICVPEWYLSVVFLYCLPLLCSLLLYVRLPGVVPQLTGVLFCFVQPFFPLCVSYWIFSVARSSNLLIFCSVMSDLLLILFIVFFISNIVFFIYRNGFESFLISSMSLCNMLNLYLPSWKSIVITIVLMSLSTNSSTYIISGVYFHWLVSLLFVGHISLILCMPVIIIFFIEP